MLENAAGGVDKIDNLPTTAVYSSSILPELLLQCVARGQGEKANCFGLIIYYYWLLLHRAAAHYAPQILPLRRAAGKKRKRYVQQVSAVN